MSAPDAVRSVVWLVEAVWPESNRPPTPQWWHPEHGWMWDANKALRFAREQDAAAYIKHGKTGGSWLRGKPTEHVFIGEQVSA